MKKVLEGDTRGAAYLFGVPVGTHSMGHRNNHGRSDAPDDAALVFVYIVLALLGGVALVQLVRHMC